MANIPQLDAEQEQKVRDYPDGFEDWARISAVNERVVKQTNLIPPVYIARTGSDAIRDNGPISTVSKFAIQYDSGQLFRGGAVEYGPHIGELESVFLTVFGRRLHVDMELASHTRGEYNEEQWLVAGLHSMESCEACALSYDANSRSSFENIRKLVEQYLTSRKANVEANQLFLAASHVQVPNGDSASLIAKGDRLGKDIRYPLLCVSVQSWNGTSMADLEAMAKLVLLRRSEQTQNESSCHQPWRFSASCDVTHDAVPQG